MSLPQTCTFVLANGVICNGLAVKGKDQCRFHNEDAERARVIREANVQRRCDMAKYTVGVTTLCKVPGLDEIFDDTSAGLFANLKLPPIEDANSINLVINTIVRALTQQVIPPRNAALILYALQIASGNLKRTRKPIPRLDKISTDPAPHLLDYSDDRLAAPIPSDVRA